MKPCVSTVLYGAAPLPASESSSEDWNQPRCWSEPSRYTSARQSAGRGLFGCCSSFRRMRTAREDEPESIHTSSVSLDFATGSAPFQSEGFTEAHSSAMDVSNQALEPNCSNNFAVLRMICASRMALPCAL